MSGDAFDEFMGGGGKNFPFETIGDQVTGTIISVQRRQQTDLTTGEPKTWPNGEPRYMFNIQLQTGLRDDEFDDGVRSINVKWQSQKAVQDAVRRAGASKLEPGGEVTLRYSGNGPKGSFPQAPKLWQANYVPPDMGASFMGPETTPMSAHREPTQYPGSPQPADPPDWARPETQPSVGARPAPRSTLDSMRTAPENLPGDRSQYGF